ncbi:MAG: hypothetical protein AABY07_02105 [Nanoarchaeota archaeon]
MTNLEDKIELCSGRITKEEIIKYQEIRRRYSRMQSIAAYFGFVSGFGIQEILLAAAGGSGDIEPHFYNLLRSLAPGLGFALIARSFGVFMTDRFSKASSSFSHYILSSIKRKKSDKIYHLRRSSELTYDIVEKHRMHAKIELLEGNYEKALEEYLLMFSILKDVNIKRSLVDRLISKTIDYFLVHPHKNLFYKITTAFKPKFEDCMNFADFNAAMTGRFDNVRKALIKALETKEGSQIGPRLLIAEFLDNSGHKYEAGKLFKESLEDILKNPDTNLVPFGKSRHEILTDKYSFVIKRYDSGDAAAREYYLTHHVRDILSKYAAARGLDEDNVKTANTLSFIEHKDGKFYLVIKRKRMNDAERELDLIDENSRDIVLKNILNNLATVTTLVTPLIKTEEFKGFVHPHDYMKEVDRRLISRIGNNGIYLQRFLSQYEGLAKGIQRLKKQHPDGLDFFTHGDAFLCNFLADGTMLDLESVVIADPTKDPATVLEHPLILDQEKKFWYYASVLQDLLQFKIDELALGDLFLMNRVCNSICQVGSKLNQNKEDQALFYFNRALDSVQLLGNKNLGITFKDYVMHSEKTAKVLS